MRSWTLRTKLLVSVMLINVLAMMFVAGIFISNNFALLDSRLESRISTELDLLSQNLGPSLLFADQQSATEMLSTLSVDPAILQAELYRSGSKQPFATYHNDMERYADSLSVEQIEFQRDVLFDGEVQGYLAVTATTQEIASQARSILWYSLAVLIVESLFVLLGAFSVQRLVTGPIHALNRLSREVATSKDYSLRSNISSRDELGQLANEFDRMLAQVQNRDVMLEKQVRQRTAELEKLAEEFRHRAFHDALTGLPNRAFLNEYFVTCSAQAERSGSRMLLMLLDLDNFKTINDSLGHNVGDELLKVVSSRLRKSLRRQDVVLRLGGDEFVILIENVDRQGDQQKIATKIASDILKNVEGEVSVLEHMIRITVSIGGSVYPDHGEDLVTLKRAADIAMYHSKSLGRNCFSMFEPRMENSAVQRLIIQNDLQKAITHEELKVVYQPKIDASSKTVIGCEALVRWEHPKEGLLSPMYFIPFAEENGMIRELDYYVLERACIQARLWRDVQQPIVKVAVNLSAIHFTDHKIVSKIEHVLSDTKIPAQQLEIEITEAMLINDPELALDILQQIHALGVTISLDDFGVGYSSLNYLRTLPIDVVKLDRSFVQNILTNPHDQRLTKGIVALTQGLELEIVAEGVETQEQKVHLLGIGCSLMQGFLYLKPCPADEFLNWLIKHPPSSVD